jgi:hypothetical protein
VSLNPIHGEVYSIKHYVIKFVSDLRQVCGFLWVLYWWNLWLSRFINFLFISINGNNWFAESMFFIGVHWMEFVSHVKFRQLQTNISTLFYLSFSFKRPSFILLMFSNGPPSSILLAHRWLWSSVNCRHNVRHIGTIPFLLPPDWNGWPLNFTITHFL